DRETLRDQNECFGPIDERQLFEELLQPTKRLVGVLTRIPGDLRRLRDDVAFALCQLARVVGPALPHDHVGEDDLIAPLLDRDGFRHTEVVRPWPGPRLLSNQALHRSPEAELV